MVNLSLAIAPHVEETVYVMSNPSLTSISEVVKNASRKRIPSSVSYHDVTNGFRAC